MSFRHSHLVSPQCDVSVITICLIFIQDRQRQQWEAERAALILQFNNDKDEQLAQFMAEKERLLAEVAALQRERDEQLYLAEAEKQEVTTTTTV